ncbi:hypothetical protein B0H14DRAFT_3872928 [Mycena olivaceomarginata]|nr:hypothetical protein B0H14DRAFT_3872928 [Mycena olivaceomarginata]
MVENPLSGFFHRGDAQNKSMYFTYCKACVTEELKKGGATATTLTQGSQTFKDAEATAEATLQRRSQKRVRTESTPTTAAEVPEPPPKKKHTHGEEKAALEAQALRAIVSSGAPFQLFEDPEMKILFGMMRTTAPEAIPSAKVMGGRLLDTAAEGVDEKVKKVMKARLLGLWYVRS